MIETAKISLNNISWQERYHASEIYTLSCKLLDRPSMLGKLITTIGENGAHVGPISLTGLDNEFKLREITIYCVDKNHLKTILGKIDELVGVSVLNIRDDVLEIHRRGTIETHSRVPITNLTDFRMVYTPGVASVCERILCDPAVAWNMTGLCDRVAIVTNGTAVLGLGDIGVTPSLPVMEGKAAIFAEFAGISAYPILVDTKDVDVFVDTVFQIAKSFGAIQLEDIAAPACFEIEKRLRDKLDIPVFHDDQHGTATVTLAALINALKQTNKNPHECSVLILGAGAAGYAIAKILLAFCVGDIVVYDSKGALYRGRTEKMNHIKHHLVKVTNKDNENLSLKDGFRNKDIFIGVARPNMVDEEMISLMKEDAIVFPLSNPVGEISIDRAYSAGAAVCGDGRSINNALAYPGLFRGALDTQAKDITFEMQIAAANELAGLAPEGSLLPDVLDRNVHKKVAQVVSSAWVEKSKIEL